MARYIKYASVLQGPVNQGAAGGDLLGTYPNPSVVAATFNATRIPLSSTPPSSGQLLGYDGANLVGFNKGMQKIGSTTASSTASVSFTGLTAAYSAYVVTFSYVQPATDGSEFYFRISTDGGSTYKAGASDYIWSNLFGTGGATSGVQGSNADTHVRLANAVGGTGARTVSGQLWVINPATLGVGLPSIVATTISFDNTGVHVLRVVSGCYATATVVNAIQFLFSAGAISTGIFTLYGVVT